MSAGLRRIPASALPVVGNIDALAVRPQVGKRCLAALDLLLVRGFHLRLIMHEQKRRKMIIDAGALQAFSSREKMLFGSCLPAELLMVRGARETRPGTNRCMMR